MSSKLRSLLWIGGTVPALRAVLVLCALLLLTAWLATRPISSLWLMVCNTAVLLLTFALAWWARGASPASQSPAGAAASSTADTLLERLRVAVEAAEVAPWEFDLASNRFVWLGARLAAFGQQTVPLHDQFENVLTLVLPEDRSKLIDAARSAIDGGTDKHSFCYRMHGVDGRVHHIQNFLRVQRDGAGRPHRMLGASWDITEQLETQAQLRQQVEHEHALRERLSLATQCAGIGFWEIDLVAQRFLWVDNPVSSLGMEERAFGSLTAFAQRVVPEDRTALPDSIKRALKDGTRRFELRYRVLTLDGAMVHIQTFGRLTTDAKGRPIQALGVSWDVTQEVATAEALRRSEAAEAASAAKSSFLLNLSHEIRTPMNGIVGMTTLLLDTRLEDGQREYAETIHNSSESLLVIVNDILDFSKIEAGKLQLEMLEVDVRRLVEEVGSIVGDQAAAKGLELVIDVADDLSKPFLADPQRLRQCLLNLLGNAVKFTSVGEIVVRVFSQGECKGGEHKGGEHEGRWRVQFEVCDTGMGIEAQTLGSLFQPFVQADSSTTRRFGGTGLGLSIVHRLVGMMGGEVSVVSAPGQGSTFTFWVPLAFAPGAAELASVPSAQPRVLEGNALLARTLAGRVLLVEDNPVNQRVARRILERMGCKVHVANNGLEGVESFARQEFDLVLMDLQMPVLDGFDATRRIRALPSGAAVPIVALTANATRGEPQRCSAEGMNGFLTKPIDVAQLQGTLAGFGLSLPSAAPGSDEPALAQARSAPRRQ